MGFWNTFLRVWQVRTAVRIQEDYEESMARAKEEQNLNENIPQIFEEVMSKNKLWERELEYQRSKLKK